ncbi:GTP 3',8-cyclase [Desulfovibrionales bacterium]
MLPNQDTLSSRMSPLEDAYGRRISYLRLSITDRCNMRCFYCRAGNYRQPIPNSDILRYEEFLDLMGLARSLGIGKIRLTGGEFFVRREAMGFIERIFHRFPDLDVRLTSNGTLLTGRIAALIDLGLGGINISLDTLRRDVFERITGQYALSTVRNSIDECLAVGLRVKVNTVALAGITEPDLPGFIQLARELPLDLRFIEFMPLGIDTTWTTKHYWPINNLLAHIRKLAELTPVPRRDTAAGPARMFEIVGGRGRIGVITALSNHFCNSCNRLRISCDGQLRTCLFSDQEYRLRPLLRHSRLGLPAVHSVIQRALRQKPIGKKLLEHRRSQAAVCYKVMSAIGG